MAPNTRAVVSGLSLERPGSAGHAPQERVATFRRPPAARGLEAILLVGALVGLGLFVFFRAPVTYPPPFRSTYLLFPLIIVAAIRFELRGAAMTTAVVFAIALAATLHGYGPLARETVGASLVAVGIFMTSAAITPLVVAGAISARARALRTTSRKNEELAREVAERKRVEEALRANEERERSARAAAERAEMEAQEQSRRLLVLSEASRSFARASQESQAILYEAARSCAELVGDMCVVRIATEEGDFDVAALHHRDPRAREDATQRLLGRRAPRAGVIARVVDTGAPVLLSGVDSREARGIDDEGPGEPTTYGLIALPLRAGADVVGVATLTRDSAKGAYTGCDVALLEDLTDRAGLALLNARLYGDLRAAVQVRDDFLAIAGHELKTPLAALLLQIQGLQRNARRDPALARIGERLEKAAGGGLRMERLINQLLDVSRIRAGKLKLEPEPVDFAELLREVVARFTDASAPASAPIRVDADPHVHGFWDRPRLDQLIANLVSNAEKYGESKPIHIELRTEGPDAVLRVTDQGIGIDEANQRRLFQRFERAGMTHRFGGFGLGLWITRQFVELSGGKIEVQSVPGNGSTFTVRLPSGRGAHGEVCNASH